MPTLLRGCAAAVLLAACPSLHAANFDLHTGTLSGWRGGGFYVTTARPSGPSLSFAVCSSDAGRPGRTGRLRFRFVVPQGAGEVRFGAFAHRPAGAVADGRLGVQLLFGPSALPLRVRDGDGWRPAAGVLPRAGRRPREYGWDVSGYAGQTLEVLLTDADDRPGCHLFVTGFRVHAGRAAGADEFAADMQELERRHGLAPLARYSSTFFTAWSNGTEEFTADRLRECDALFRHFFEHFRARGFALRQPREKLMVAAFGTQAGFEACLGRPMPASITGVYNRLTNRLVLYDLHHNESVLAYRARAADLSKKVGNDLGRKEFLERALRQAGEVSDGLNTSTAMHEAAHHISFNCGLLNREGDVPLWLGEGLACYCEATDGGAWQGIGAVNTERLDALAAAARRRRLLPLRDLVTSDAWGRSSTQSSLEGYAQSWALFRFLMEHRRAGLRDYLQSIYDRRTPDHRLEDFALAFGRDLGRLEADYRAYVADLAARAGQ